MKFICLLFLFFILWLFFVFFLFNFFLRLLKTLRRNLHYKWFSWYIKLLVLFFIEGKRYSKFFINKRLITILILFFLNCLLNPLTKFYMFSICSRINTKLKVLLTWPELFWIYSLNFSHLFTNMLLILIVIIWFIWFKISGISKLIKQKST